MDASSVPARRAESNSGASAAFNTVQGDGEVLPAVLSGRAAHELSSWGQLPATIKGRTRGQSQRPEREPAEEQYRLNPEVADALPAAAHEWTKSGCMLKSTSWTTEDTMAILAGRPAVEENKGELSVRMPSGFPEDVEPALPAGPEEASTAPPRDELIVSVVPSRSSPAAGTCCACFCKTASRSVPHVTSMCFRRARPSSSSSATPAPPRSDVL